MSVTAAPAGPAPGGSDEDEPASPGAEMNDGVRSPSGWVHPVLYRRIDPGDTEAPGVAWRAWSERVAQTSRRWTVRTLTSRYRLDLAAGTVTRFEFDEPDRAAVDSGLVPRNRLGGDEEPLVLLAVLDCRLEHPMVLLLDLDFDPDGRGGAGTIRVTTPVATVRPDSLDPQDG